MNVIDYDTEASFRLSDELKMLIQFADSKYFRFSLASKTDVLEYKEEVAENIDSQDYVVRLDKTSHVILSSQTYSKVVDRGIGVIHGLTGTTITLN